MNVPTLQFRPPASIFILVLAFVLCCPLVSLADETPPKHVVKGGCPDLIDLIKDLTPAVVNISIERHMLQNSSTEPPPLFRSKPGSQEDQSKKNDKFQSDSVGSGFLCDASGHIVTNAHVVEGASKIVVTLSTGKVVAAKLVAIHPKVDLALLKIAPPYALQKARIGDSTNVQVGEWVLAVGNPFGLGRTVTVGIVSGKGRFLGLGPDDNFIQTDASINPGNSGGPLFNMSGEVIGVNTAIIASGKGIGFAIPSNYLTELTRLPGNADLAIRGWLGIYVEDVTSEQAKKIGLSTHRGTWVDEVLNSTPAHNAGLKKGDLILDADGKAIRNGRHLSRVISSFRPGDILKMKILRGRQAQMVDVVLGKSPE
ncbi:MAG: trypsin-like peptidase domain-containing protein [Desulfomonile tiedjei]|uniref:Trypsin-like peptidase domain-containing protein n=1 Tax=Desulfomonile tiedjei TaxID=2358 RepID=A0A9D6YZ36_9BACT|nr:trypsin-like peptidase domain-containing protein [Desulfomonile tiedjei]